MNERRNYPRHPASIPVSVSSADRKDRVGVALDVSAGGLLFHGVSRFVPGELVTIKIAVTPDGDRVLTGKVLRTFRATEPHHLFRHISAIKFIEPMIELDQVA